MFSNVERLLSAILIGQWLNADVTPRSRSRSVTTKCIDTCLSVRVEVVKVGRRLRRFVRLRLRLDFVPRLLEVEVARLLSVGGCVGGCCGERRPRDDNGLASENNDDIISDPSDLRCCLYSESLCLFRVKNIKEFGIGSRGFGELSQCKNFMVVISHFFQLSL